MADQSPRLSISKFAGVFTNVTPNEVPPGGAQSQVNCRSQIVGQLDVRPGVKPITFSNDTGYSGSNSNVIGMYQSPTIAGTVVVLYQTANGDIHTGTTPSL